MKSKLKDRLKATRQVKEAIREPFAWPGGYLKTVICSDGGCLCPPCAHKEWYQICHDTIKGWATGWEVVGSGIIWEGKTNCDECQVNLAIYTGD
jgi:hypothetical protein